jgi:hypothetical protein
VSDDGDSEGQNPVGFDRVKRTWDEKKGKYTESREIELDG